MAVRRVMLAAVVVAFPVGTVHAKRKPMHVEVVSLAVNSDTCCLTYRVVPASAGRLLIDTRDGCADAGRQWRGTLTLPGREGGKSGGRHGSCSGVTGPSKKRGKAREADKLTLFYHRGARR